jgi:hypothetical protein
MEQMCNEFAAATKLRFYPDDILCNTASFLIFQHKKCPVLSSGVWQLRNKEFVKENK